MKPDFDRLEAMKPTERHNLWINARKRPSHSEEARAWVILIETSGLDYRLHATVRLDDDLGRAMQAVVFSPEGKTAALNATDRGLPALAGVDPLLVARLGPDYRPENEATAQAGFLVTNLMRQLGYKTSHRGLLPSGCVAKTGWIFRRAPDYN